MALVLATAQVGCSIAFVKGRPDLITPQAPPDCTESMIVPGVEAAISLTAIASTLFLGLGAIAIGGFKVRRCRRAHEEHRALRNAPMLQPGYPPPGYPPPVQMPPPGFERGACRIPPAPACEAGLACASGYCVRPPMQ